MEVFFISEKLRDICSDERARMARWGKDGAKKIDLRLQQLAAAPSLHDMRTLPGRCHELTGDRRGQLAVDLHHPFRMIFRPSAEPPPVKPDGGLDWASVESIIVIDIVDYH